jgi:hypothetical protein
MLTISIVVSCDEDSEINNTNIVYYTGIVQTDSEGNIIEEDYNDWQPRERIGWVYDSLYSIPAYPNPAGKDSVQIDFQSLKFLGCVIGFTLPRNSLVTIEINDKPDRVVRTLLSESEKNVGAYRIAWDLKNDDGNKLPNGIYRVYITAVTDYFNNVIKTYGDIQVH